VKATSVAEKSKAGAFSVPPLYRKVALPSSEFCPAHSLDISRQLSQPSQNLIIRDQWLAAKNSNQRAHHRAAANFQRNPFISFDLFYYVIEPANEALESC
jgi:hypothetical protein